MAMALVLRRSTDYSTRNRARKGGTVEDGCLVRFGTVDCRERVSDRTRPDYERIMQLVSGLATKKGGKIGHRSIRSGNGIQNANGDDEAAIA